jgi:hypothetical protein
MPALAFDTFNRANENPLSGGGVWSTVTSLGNMQVISNVCSSQFDTDCGSRYSGIAWPDDQYSKAKLVADGTLGGGRGACLLVRVAAAAQTFYRLAVDHAASSNVELARFNAGAHTELATFTQAWSDGATWELRIIGAKLTVLLNGAVVQALTDGSPLASGSPGVGYSSTITSASLDDWEGGVPEVARIRQRVRLPEQYR